MYIIMKRSTRRALTAAAVIVAAGIALWGIKYSFKVPVIKTESLLSLIPEKFSGKSIVGVIGVNDFHQVYGDIKKTNFFEALKNSDFYLKLTNNSSFNEEKEKKILQHIGKEAVFAVYESEGKLNFLLLSKINDKTGLKELAVNIKNNNSSVEYKNVKVNTAGNFYYCLENKIAALSETEELIYQYIDVMKNESKEKNFTAAFPWVESVMDRSAAGFTFISKKELSENLSRYSQQKFNFKEYAGNSPNQVYQEYRFDRGFVAKSYVRKREAGGESETGEAHSLALLPHRPIVAGAVTSVNFKEQWKKINRTGYVSVLNQNVDVKEKIIPEFSGELGYAVLGPTSESLNSALPVMAVVAFTKTFEGTELIKEEVFNLLNLDPEQTEYKGTSYEKAEFPLFFGQKIQICSVSLKYKGRNFIAVTTSEDALQTIIELSKGKGRSLRKSSAWKDISGFLPSDYSSVSYADINALLGTVGLFLANIRGNTELTDFIHAGPFSWAGPLGSASISSGEYTIISSYLPVRDLSIEKWDEILSALNKLVF